MKYALPLFLTNLSLSSRSAIGVQTKLMLEQFPDWRHLFWDARDFQPNDPRSTVAESFLFAHFTMLKHEPLTLPAWFLSGLSWWKTNALKPRFARRLQKEYAATISAIYAAPCSIRDSERMKSVLESLNKPFILHLWDVLDHNQIDSLAFRWLLKNAVHVLCLSKPMLDYIHSLRPDATILGFTRKQSNHLASPPAQGSLRIALIGNCGRYPDGLSLLRDATLMVRNRGIQADVIYLGDPESTQSWSSSLSNEVRSTGFLPTDDARDRELAHCHIGFLPGPLISPSKDMLSRFSIPSRILDFLATGLPTLAAAHPESATAAYMNSIGLKECIVDNSAESLAEKLIALAAVDRWRTYSEMSLSAFQASLPNPGDLKHWMERAAASAEMR